MKALLTTLTLGMALATGVFAQGKPSTPPAADSMGKATSSTKVADAMKNLPAGVADKIAAAKAAAKAAKADIDAMKASGKTPEEIQATITEKKAAAILNLQKAIDALNGLPDVAKEKVTKAKEVVTKRLDERKADAKANP